MSRSSVRIALAALGAGVLSLAACRQGALPRPHVQTSATPLPSPPPEPAGPADPGAGVEIPLHEKRFHLFAIPS